MSTLKRKKMYWHTSNTVYRKAYAFVIRAINADHTKFIHFNTKVKAGRGRHGLYCGSETGTRSADCFDQGPLCDYCRLLAVAQYFNCYVPVNERLFCGLIKLKA